MQEDVSRSAAPLPHLRSIAVRLTLGLVILIGGSLPSGPASGQDTATRGDTGSPVLEEVVVEAERENPTSLLEEPPRAEAGGLVAEGAQLGPLGNRDIMDVPFSVTAFTDTFTENQQAIGLRDVTNSDPSVTSESARGSFFDGFRIRGLRANYVFDGLPGVFDRGNALSTEEYARIEVLKGPLAVVGAGVNGQDFVGGLVNLVPKRATEDPVTNLHVNYLSGDAFRQHVDVGRRFGVDDRFGVRVNAVSENGEINVEGTTLDRESFNTALDYRGENTRFTADIGYQDRATAGVHPNFLLDPSIDVPDPPELDRTYGQPWQKFRAERLRTVLRLERDLGSNWTLGASYSDVHLNERGPSEATAFVFNNAGDYSHTLFLNSSASRDYTDYTAYLKGDFRTGFVRHNLAMTGSSGEDQNDLSKANAGDFFTVLSNLDDPVYVDEPADTRVEETPFSTNENRFVSLVDDMSFQDGTYRLIAGAQWIEFSRRSYTFFSPRSLNEDFETDEVVPISGFVFQPARNRSYYLSYAESLDRGDQAPAGAANPGEVTDPTVAEQAELGMKRDHGVFRYQVAGFHTTKDNTFTDPSGVFGNFGEQVHQGLEVELTGEPVDGFRTIAGVMYLDAEQKKTPGGANDGNDPVATPDVRASLSGEYDVALAQDDVVTLTGGVFHTGEQYADAANTQEVDAWTRLDLGARYTVRDSATGAPFTARLKVENVTDEEYWDNAAFGLTPGTPRTMLLNLSAHF